MNLLYFTLLAFGSAYEFNGSYKISPKPCSIENNTNSGICMFVWECLKSDGRHLGMCVDGFMFGSCCYHNVTSNVVDALETAVAAVANDFEVEDVQFLTRSTTTTTTTTTSTTPPTTTRSTTTTPTTPPPPNTSTYISLLTPPTTESPSIFQNITAKYTGCGLAPLKSPQKRIVGGSEAKYGQFPWQVSVRRTSFFGFSSTHRCGGALVNEQWVATAGHCVDDLMTSQIRIRLGEYDFSVTTEKYPSTERGVTKKLVHPSYNFFTYENDLALLKLDSPIPLGTPHIIPICLPGNDDLLIGENATVTGWGRLSEGGQLPSKLQHVQVPIISNEKCRDMFLKSGRMEYIPEIFLCAGYENGGRDSCQGDSGGPLQVLGADHRYFLAGIISWGIGCAEPNMPGVCTRISKFREFILKTVRE